MAWAPHNQPSAKHEASNGMLGSEGPLNTGSEVLLGFTTQHFQYQYVGLSVKLTTLIILHIEMVCQWWLTSVRHLRVSPLSLGSLGQNGYSLKRNNIYNVTTHWCCES